MNTTPWFSPNGVQRIAVLLLLAALVVWTSSTTLELAKTNACPTHADSEVIQLPAPLDCCLILPPGSDVARALLVLRDDSSIVAVTDIRLGSSPSIWLSRLRPSKRSTLQFQPSGPGEWTVRDGKVRIQHLPRAKLIRRIEYIEIDFRTGKSSCAYTAR